MPSQLLDAVDDSYAAADAKVRTLLAAHTATSADDWHVVFKARQAMELVFACIARELGTGTVLTQLLTCCTAVNPIISAGLTPRYGECSRATLSLDPNCIELASSDRAVVLQHSFGIVDDVDSEAIVAIAHAHHIPVLEDSCHCTGRMARNCGSSRAPLADFSFHSFGVQKMLPTYFGGALWINPESPFRSLCKAVASSAAQLSVVDSKRARAAQHYPAQIRFFNHVPARLSHSLRTHLYASGRFEPAVADCELHGEMSGVPARPSSWVLEQMAKALLRLPHIEEIHRTTIDEYRQKLLPSGLVPESAFARPTQPLLRMPIVLRSQAEAEGVAAAIQRAGFYPDSWGRPELTPGVADPLPYHIPVDSSCLQVVTSLSEGILGLPADIGQQADDLASLVLATVGSSRAC